MGNRSVIEFSVFAKEKPAVITRMKVKNYKSLKDDISFLSKKTSVC